MVAFGGAGPVHAAAVARGLGIATVLLPRGAGVASAHGCLAQAPAFEQTRSWPGQLDVLDLAEVEGLLHALEGECRGYLQRAGGEAIQIEYWAAMRYVGQGSEIPVRLGEVGGSLSVEGLLRQFEATYTELFGRTAPGNPVEAVSWRVRVSGAAPELITPQVAPGCGLPYAVAPALFGGEWWDTPRYRRHELPERLEGPILVVDTASTLVVPPEARVILLPDGSLRMELS